jgi:hypothetical protein
LNNPKEIEKYAGLGYFRRKICRKLRAISIQRFAVKYKLKL